MYAKVKKSLPEMYAFTVCMWLKSSAAPGVGTPFSYAVPGQANELVLIEWGNNPMEILINDKVMLPQGRAHPEPWGVLRAASPYPCQSLWDCRSSRILGCGAMVLRKMSAQPARLGEVEAGSDWRWGGTSSPALIKEQGELEHSRKRP